MTEKKALSPAISSIIMTGAVVILLLVTVVFANNFLNARIAENEFNAMKQFMQTSGLQIDDVAWIIGRTQTIRYASRFGQVNFEPVALRYSIYVDSGSGYVFLTNYTTGILLFNMPIIHYSVADDYYECIFPSTDRSFLQEGTSAPVTHIYVIEKLPMNDGDFIRVIAAPSVRMLNSTISTGGVTKHYFKFYLPLLSAGTNPRYSQSITLAGKTISVQTADTVNKFKIRVSTPKASLGFDQSFFRFENVEEEVDVPDGSIVQFYTGEVILSLGLHA
jgi:hypothetical protein